MTVEKWFRAELLCSSQGTLNVVHTTCGIETFTFEQPWPEQRFHIILSPRGGGEEATYNSDID